MAGACVDVERPKGTGGNTGFFDAGATGGASGTGGAGAKGTGGSQGAAGAGAGSGATTAPPEKISTCACETSEGPSGSAFGLALGLAAWVLQRRSSSRRPGSR
jgi:MYXO-CTERM domain-containing protein